MHMKRTTILWISINHWIISSEMYYYFVSDRRTNVRQKRLFFKISLLYEVWESNSWLNSLLFCSDALGIIELNNYEFTLLCRINQSTSLWWWKCWLNGAHSHNLYLFFLSIFILFFLLLFLRFHLFGVIFTFQIYNTDLMKCNLISSSIDESKP